MDRDKIELEWLKFESDSPTLFAEHIAAIARSEALEDAEKAIYLLEKDMTCVNAIRALKEQK